MSHSSATIGDDYSNLRYFFWFGAIVVGMAGYFWSAVTSLSEAWQLPEYSHGILIPFLSVYLVLRSASRAESLSPILPVWTGVLAVIISLLLGLVGNLASIPDITAYAMLLCIGGLLILVRGGRIDWWPAWVLLFFMLPLPNFIYWPLSIKLQMISSQWGVALIQAIGVPVYLEGNVIDLGNYKLQVAEACNGLRYLFPLMSFGFLIAVLYDGPIWQRTTIFLATVPITILMNSFRIAITGLLVDKLGIEQAEGFLHFFEGWIIFLACLALLFLIAWGLQRFDKRQSLRSVLDLNLRFQRPLLGRLPRSSHVPLTLAATAIAISALLWHATPARLVETVVRQPLQLFPMQLAEWHGSSSALSEDVKSVLGADDYVLAEFDQTDGNFAAPPLPP